MAATAPQTIREQIAWSYANLARAHAALEDGAMAYRKVHHVIRNKVYHGLLSGTMAMRSLCDDERLKMTSPQVCCYCGAPDPLTVDHLIPRLGGGPDDADNLVWACRSCNSSKRDRDLIVWSKSRGVFPSILLLRRYLKLVAKHCAERGCLDLPLERAHELGTPFDVLTLPTTFPRLAELTLWVTPRETGATAPDNRRRSVTPPGGNG